MSLRNRQPEGIPSGGEFATRSRAETSTPANRQFLPPGTHTTIAMESGEVSAVWQGGIGGERFLETENGTKVRFTPAIMGATSAEVGEGANRPPGPSRLFNESDDLHSVVGDLLEISAGQRAVKSIFRQPSEFVQRGINQESTDGRLDRMTIRFDGPEQNLRDDDGVEVAYDFASGQMTSSSVGEDPHDGAQVVAEKTGHSPQQSFEAVHRALLKDPESGITG